MDEKMKNEIIYALGEVMVNAIIEVWSEEELEKEWEEDAPGFMAYLCNELQQKIYDHLNNKEEDEYE